MIYVEFQNISIANRLTILGFLSLQGGIKKNTGTSRIDYTALTTASVILTAPIK